MDSTPRRFKVGIDSHIHHRQKLLDAGKPEEEKTKFIYGCYFPGTDLCVYDTGSNAYGKPYNVDWIDESPFPDSVGSLPSIPLVCFFLFFFLFHSISASEWFVSPSGKSTGNGSLDQPWDLQTALNHPPGVGPGDTIWLRGGEYLSSSTGGTYIGTFHSRLIGTEDKPIVVRNYNDERASIMASFPGGRTGNSYSLMVEGRHVWLWGLELTSDPRITSMQLEQMGGPGQPEWGAGGINCAGTVGHKFINLIVHDTLRVGITAQSTNSEYEIYGCLIYYNGRHNSLDNEAPVYKGGYGTYLANGNPAKPIVAAENILFHQWGWPGLHAYTKGGSIDNVQYEGNIVIDNAMDLGGVIARNPIIRDNFVYRAYSNRHMGRESTAAGLFLPWGSGGTINAIVERNFVIDGFATIGVPRTGMKLEGNIFNGYVGDGSGTGVTYTSTQRDFPSNTYASYRSKPGVAWPPDIKLNQVFVRPNKYEPGRAHIIVWNYDESWTTEVNLSSVLKDGSKYRIQDALDFYGDSVVSGIYSGPVRVPMAKKGVAKPFSIPSKSWQGVPEHTLPRLGVFVLFSDDDDVVIPPPPPPPLVKKVKIIAPVEGTRFVAGETVTAKGEGDKLSWFIDFAGSTNPAQQAGSEVRFTVPTNTTKVTLALTGEGGRISQSHPVEASPPPPPPPAKDQKYERIEFFRGEDDGKIYYKDGDEYKLLGLR